MVNLVEDVPEVGEDDDLVAVVACFVCDLCAHLGVEYDPAIGTLLLQYVGGIMGSSPEKWERYTTDVAPQCNVNKLRKMPTRTPIRPLNR